MLIADNRACDAAWALTNRLLAADLRRSAQDLRSPCDLQVLVWALTIGVGLADSIHPQLAPSLRVPDKVGVLRSPPEPRCLRIAEAARS